MKAAFLALYATLFPWPHIQYGWKPASSPRALPPRSPAAFDAEPVFPFVPGFVSRSLGSRLYPQALGSARFIITAPAICDGG